MKPKIELIHGDGVHRKVYNPNVADDLRMAGILVTKTRQRGNKSFDLPKDSPWTFDGVSFKLKEVPKQVTEEKEEKPKKAKQELQ